MRTTVRGMLIAGVLALGFTLFDGSKAQAQWGHYHGGGIHYGHGFGGHYGGYHGGFTAPVYHPPSVHYDAVYHPTSSHWTPLRGWHTHGHYDLVPHYTPGHFDTYHNGHIHGNPYYHH